MTFNEVLVSNLQYIVVGLIILSIISLVVAITASSRYYSLKSRYEFFMGTNRKPDENLEKLLREYVNTVRFVEKEVEENRIKIDNVSENILQCVQKVGIVRYNPYEEMGGNLCFAVALLDSESNGIVFNGIHSRTGSFTYAKPIEAGTSTYVLSVEELEAIKRAENTSFKPKIEEEA